jgi:hypothetical protein
LPICYFLLYHWSLTIPPEPREIWAYGLLEGYCMRFEPHKGCHMTGWEGSHQDQERPSGWVVLSRWQNSWELTHVWGAPQMRRVWYQIAGSRWQWESERRESGLKLSTCVCRGQRESERRVASQRDMEER